MTTVKLGYVEGKNIIFESRSAVEKPERYPAGRRSWSVSEVDVLVATSTDEILAFKNATRTIPIVYIGPPMI